MSRKRAQDDSIAADYRAVSRAMDRVILPALIERGVTMAQFKALIALDAAGKPVPGAAGGLTVTGLGTELSIGQPSASELVAQLEARGYVMRAQDAEDRRRTRVSVTPAGADLVAELRHGRRSTFLGWLERVSDEDAEALAQGMKALAKAAETGE